MFSYKVLFTISLILAGWGCLSGQSSEAYQVLSTDEPGIHLRNDSILLSEEIRLLLSDAEYRAAVYPEQYAFEALPEMLEEQRILLSLWHLINLYDQQQVLTLRLVKDLTQLGIGPEEYIYAFKTYAFTDPQVFTFHEGKPVLNDPLALRHKMTVANFLAAQSGKYSRKP